MEGVHRPRPDAKLARIGEGLSAGWVMAVLPEGS